MQIKKSTGCFERIIRLVQVLPATAFQSLILIGLLASCAPTTEIWDPLQDQSAPASTGIQRQTDRLSPAMASLIQQADTKINYEQWPEAIAILERALRINPKQAEAWTRMAVVYLGKLEPEQAMQMAKKSNALAARDTALQAYNWKLIARAYEQMNQPDKARHAAGKSLQLQAD